MFTKNQYTHKTQSQGDCVPQTMFWPSTQRYPGRSQKHSLVRAFLKCKWLREHRIILQPFTLTNTSPDVSTSAATHWFVPLHVLRWNCNLNRQKDNDDQFIYFSLKLGWFSLCCIFYFSFTLKKNKYLPPSDSEKGTSGFVPDLSVI